MTEEAFKIFSSSKKSFDEIGQLLDTHWQIKKSLAKTVTTGDIDQIYDTAKKAGALGGKLLGAGGGGFFIFFVKPELKQQLRAKLKKLPHVPFKLENEGSQVIYHLPFTEQWNN